MKIYNPSKNVLEAAKERISWLFDEFKNIQVSISSGKDSTVLYFLCLHEAIKRNRKIQVFFLDQEAEYAASIEVIKKQMNHENVIPLWYQIPIYMTNATSYSDYFLYAWGEGEQWIREKDPMAIHKVEEPHPDRFYEFFPWLEKKGKDDTAYLIGIRAEEGIIRYRAVTKYTGYKDVRWGTISNGANRFYPIYDWTIYDIWKFTYDYNITYNKIYDLMFMDNVSIYNKMRVSNLIHEKSYKCLLTLPKYEPETYNKLCKRIAGISTAMRYASEKLIFSNKNLPKHYSNWKEFRDFLLENIQKEDHKNTFKERFDKQKQTEDTYQAQVGQLLINDYENSCAFDTKKGERKQHVKDKWINLI